MLRFQNDILGKSYEEKAEKANELLDASEGGGAYMSLGGAEGYGEGGRARSSSSSKRKRKSGSGGSSYP